MRNLRTLKEPLDELRDIIHEAKSSVVTTEHEIEILKARVAENEEYLEVMRDRVKEYSELLDKWETK